MNSAPPNIAELFAEFEEAFGSLPAHFSPRKANENLYFLGPHDGESIDLCIAAMVHGNETGGLMALTGVLKLLAKNDISFGKKIALFIGNTRAALDNQRFVHRDLNRSFGRQFTETEEDQIARRVEPFLSETKFILDLHQTNNPTLSDFFIFPHSENNIRFAWHLAKDVPIVVHEKQFSVDGMCLDSFVTLNGGIGVTYEMGQIGNTEYQLHKTMRLLSRAFSVQTSNFPLNAPLPSSIFVFDQVVMAENGFELSPGLSNFMAIQEGDILATGPNGNVKSKYTGHVLFPKYGDQVKGSSELCRIVRSVPFTDSEIKKSIYTVSN